MLLLLTTLVGSLACAVPHIARTATGPGAERRVLAPSADASLLPRSATPHDTKRERFSAFEGAVPVLLYHRLIAREDGYSVAPAAFDAQIRRLRLLGFEAITVGRYASRAQLRAGAGRRHGISGLPGQENSCGRAGLLRREKIQPLRIRT